MTEQNYDPEILARLIEEHKHIWEDDIEDHILLEVYYDETHINNELAQISTNNIFSFYASTIEQQILVPMIFNKLREAGRVIQVDLRTRGSNENWLRDAIDNQH